MTCDAKDCPRRAVHKLELEWTHVHLCCEHRHGETAVRSDIPLGNRSKCTLAA